MGRITPSEPVIRYRAFAVTIYDLVLLFVLPCAAAVTVLALELPYLGSILLFFGIPSLWMSYRARRSVAHVALFSALLAPPFAIVVNYLGVRDGSWYVPLSVFPRYLGRLPWEDVVLLFLGGYSILIFYKFVLDGGARRLVEPRVSYYVLLLATVLVVFFALYHANPAPLQFSFAYLWIGVVLLALPTGLVLLRYPRLIRKFGVVGAYYCVVVGLFELVGVSRGHWIFPGDHFLGLINYFGFPIPVEELVFFVLLVSLAVVSYYEFLDDDRA